MSDFFVKQGKSNLFDLQVEWEPTCPNEECLSYHLKYEGFSLGKVCSSHKTWWHRLFISTNLLDFLNIRYIANTQWETTLEPLQHINSLKKLTCSNQVFILSQMWPHISPLFRVKPFFDEQKESSSISF